MLTKIVARYNLRSRRRPLALIENLEQPTAKRRRLMTSSSSNTGSSSSGTSSVESMVVDSPRVPLPLYEDGHDISNGFYKPPSKSDYLHYNTHPVKGWLNIFSRSVPELATLVNDKNNTKQWIFDEGHEVGDFAQHLFPGSEVIEFIPGENNPISVKRDAQQTLAMMRRGCRAICEATFTHDGGLCHTDILVEKQAFESMKREAECRKAGLPVLNPLDFTQMKRPTADTEWVVLEVKSSLHVSDRGGILKPEKLADASFQYHQIQSTLQKEGLGNVSTVHFVYPDKAYVKPSSDPIDPWNYFLFEDVTDQVMDNQPHLREQFKAFKDLILSTPIPPRDPERSSQWLEEHLPDFTLGEWCHHPFGEACPFLSVYMDRLGIPYENGHFNSDSIFSISSMPFKYKAALYHAGCETFQDLKDKTPQDLTADALRVLPKRFSEDEMSQTALYDLLAPTYQFQIDKQLEAPSRVGIPRSLMDVDRVKLRQFFQRGTLKSSMKCPVQFPIVAMDFETVNHALPRYEHMVPWAQVPFQVSLVRMQSPTSAPEYGSFPSTAEEFKTHIIGQDPRHTLSEKIVNFIYDSRIPHNERTTILAWNAPFEMSRLRDMLEWENKQHAMVSDDETEIQKGLQQVMDNLVDLMEPYKKRAIYSPLFQGKCSLKTVYPVMNPTDSDHYHEMSVQNGANAAQTYAQLESGEITGDVADQACEDLITYCNFDSEATLSIFKRLWNHHNSRRIMFSREERQLQQALREPLEDIGSDI